MIEDAKKAIAKLHCGSAEGTAFMINNSIALTVTHCVLDAVDEEKDIVLTFYNVDGREKFIVEAELVSGIPNSPVAILKLKEAVETKYLELVCYEDKIARGEKLISYGYPKVKGDEGYPVDLLVNDYLNDNVSSDYDIATNIKSDNRLRDFSGMSGSPVIYRNQVIGLLIEERLENGGTYSQAIDLKVISNQKVKVLYEKKDIPVLVRSYYELEKNVASAQLPKEYHRKEINNDRQINYTEAYVTRITEYEEMIEDYENVIGSKLNEIYKLKNQGACDKAWTQLISLTEEVRMSKSKPVKILAKLYYTRAIWYLDDKRDRGNAQKYLKKALELDPNYDCRTFDAKKYFLEGNVIKEKEVLLPIDNVSVLNVYLQMCIYKNELEDAFAAYRTGSSLANDSTYYLMTLIYILDGEYELAEEYLQKAEQNNTEVPMYVMMRGVIRYWKLLPQSMVYGDCLLPPMYSNTMLLLDKETRKELESIIELYEKSYVLAENIGNIELQKQILVVWLNTLSISEDYRKDGKKIAEKLLKIEPYQCQAIMYLCMTGEDFSLLNEDEIIELVKKLGTIEAMLSCVYVLLGKNNKKGAYSYLKEYKYKFDEKHMMECWFELAVHTCEDEKEIEEMKVLLESYNMPKVTKARIGGLLFACLKEYDKLLEYAENLYSETKSEIDLINLINCCERAEKWDKSECYSREWENNFCNPMSKIRIIRTLAMQNKQEECLAAISDLEDVMDEEYITAEVRYYEIQALKILGRYDKAIEKAERLWDEVVNQKVLFLLAECYFLNGQEQDTVYKLKDGIRKGINTVEVYQMLAEYERCLDTNEAAKYAKKACIQSNDDPHVMMWAMQFLFVIGKSDKANELFVKLQTIDRVDGFRVMTFKEVREWLNALQIENEDRYNSYKNCQFSYHLFMDALRNASYTLYCYRIWKYNQKQQVNKQSLFVNYGGHRIQNDILENILGNSIVLDFSSIVHLQHFDLLKEVVNYCDEIYIPGSINGIISFEQKNCMVNQPDVLAANKKMMEIWKTRELHYIPLPTEEKASLWIKSGIEVADIVPYELAKENQLFYISDSFVTDLMENSKLISDEMRQAAITTSELFCALEQRGDISPELKQRYNGQNKKQVRDSIVSKLVSYEGKVPILVDINFLSEVYELDGVVAISQKCIIYVLEGVFATIENDLKHVEEGKEVIDFLNVIKNDLDEWKEEKHIRFIAHHPNKDLKNQGIFTSSLYDLIQYSVDKKIVFVSDDRWINSYDNIGECCTCSSLDIIELMYKNKVISEEKYVNVISQMLIEGYSFIIPPFEYMKSVLSKATEGEDFGTTLPEEVSLVSNYLINITASENRLSDNIIGQGVMPESTGYMYHLQKDLMRLLKAVWCSERSLLWKEQVSSWLLVNYSVFTYKSLLNTEYMEKNNGYYELELANFLFSGFCEIPDSVYRKSYYKWLFKWLEINMQWEKGLKEKAFNHLGKIISNIYHKEAKGEVYYEIGIGAILISVMNDMPERYKNEIYNNQYILPIVERFENTFVFMGKKDMIPVHSFYQWIEEAMIHGIDNSIICKVEGTNREYKVTFVANVLFYQGFKIEYVDETGENSTHYYRIDQAMLMSSDKILRDKGLCALSEYLNPSNMKKYIIDINRSELREEIVNKIVDEVKATEEYFMYMIQYALENRNFTLVSLDELFPDEYGFFENLGKKLLTIPDEQFYYLFGKCESVISDKICAGLFLYVIGCLSQRKEFTDLVENMRIRIAMYYTDIILKQICLCYQDEKMKYSLDEIDSYLYQMNESMGYLDVMKSKATVLSKDEVQKNQMEVKKFFREDISERAYSDMSSICNLLYNIDEESSIEPLCQIKQWICCQWKKKEKQDEKELLKIMEYVAYNEAVGNQENMVERYLTLWKDVLNANSKLYISDASVYKLRSLILVFNFEQSIRMREIVEKIILTKRIIDI